MRKNKKNWEIFSKGVKNIAIVCNHIPTTLALITTTNNRENNMNINYEEEIKKIDKIYSHCVSGTGRFIIKRLHVNKAVRDLGYEIIYKGESLFWKSLDTTKYPEIKNNYIKVFQLNHQHQGWYRKDLLNKLFNKVAQ